MTVTVNDFNLSLMLWIWVLGVAVCEGFWLTLLSILFPPFAWVMAFMWVTERFS